MTRLDAATPAAVAIGEVDLASELAALPTLGFAELQARFQRLYKTPAPAGLSRELVARLVAQRLQERALGKLDRDLAALLDGHACGAKGLRGIKSGTVLVREPAGIMQEVVIIPGGFLWNGETHRSLSTIAKRITGTSWNGPRFFGLRTGTRRLGMEAGSNA